MPRVKDPVYETFEKEEFQRQNKENRIRESVTDSTDKVNEARDLDTLKKVTRAGKTMNGLKMKWSKQRNSLTLKRRGSP